jgi:hypothetical protein
MILEEAKTAFYEATATLSDNTRKLLFAGIAVVWMFKTGEKSAAGIGFSPVLLWPLGAFVFGLILDIAQYLYKGIAWWAYYAAKHAQGVADNGKISPPGTINLPTFLFYYGKVGACAYGYYKLLSYIWAAL